MRQQQDIALLFSMADSMMMSVGVIGMESEETITVTGQVLAFIEALFILHAARQV